MSAAARKWADRQQVEGRSAALVLRILADAADQAGRCSLPQQTIGRRAGLKERAVRNALATLHAAGLILRERRSAGGRKGRISDLITLPLVGAIDVGATGTKCRLQSWGQPAKKAVSPTSRKTQQNQRKAPYIERYIDAGEPTSPPRSSGRLWFEPGRGKWRARIRLNGADLNLGRFETETEAARALEGALADIRHTSSTKVGTPREPKPTRSDLDIETLGAAWPDTFSAEWREQYALEKPVAVPHKRRA